MKMKMIEIILRKFHAQIPCANSKMRKFHAQIPCANSMRNSKMRKFHAQIPCANSMRKFQNAQIPCANSMRKFQNAQIPCANFMRNSKMRKFIALANLILLCTTFPTVGFEIGNCINNFIHFYCKIILLTGYLFLQPSWNNIALTLITPARSLKQLISNLLTTWDKQCEHNF